MAGETGLLELVKAALVAGFPGGIRPVCEDQVSSGMRVEDSSEFVDK